jgi:hypothetical protein
MTYKVELLDKRVLTIEGGQITGDGKPEELKFMAQMIYNPFAYYPDYDLALATKIVEVYLGKIIERPPEQKYDPNMVY